MKNIIRICVASALVALLCNMPPVMAAPADAMGAFPDHAAFVAAQQRNGNAIGVRVAQQNNGVTFSKVKPVAAQAASAPAAKGALSVTVVQQNPLTLLQQFSTDDVNAALKLAQAQNPPDQAAINCYQAILPVLQSIQAPTTPTTPIGAFTALQMARDAKATALNLLSPTGPLQGIANACAPLVLDAQNTLIGLGVSVGLVANPVGGLAAAGAGTIPAALGAFLAALPKPL